MATKKKNLLLLEKLQDFPVLKLKLSGRWLTRHLYFATKHQEEKEELIYQVFKNCVMLLFLAKRSKLFRNKISSMLECQVESKWTIFLDKLTTLNDQNILTTILLLTLLQELTSKEKAYQPFWKPVYKNVSEKLLLPTGTDFVALDTNSSTNWLKKEEVKSRFLTIQKTSLVNKNLPKTYLPSSISFPVNKWVEDVMPKVEVKTLQIKIYPTKKQKDLLDEFIDTSRFVYNRTIEFIEKRGHKVNFQSLRDLLVTENTKKGYDEYKEYDSIINDLRKQKLKLDSKSDEYTILKERINQLNQERRDLMKCFVSRRNYLVHDFELKTPKDIRSNAVHRCCSAYKSGWSNLKAGNIKYFNMAYKKKTDGVQTIELTPQIFSIKDNKFQIAPETFKEECFLKYDKRNIKKIKNIKIDHNVFITRKSGTSKKVKHKLLRKEYYLNIPINTILKQKKTFETVCGVDPGIRTFATVHSNNIKSNDTSITEYKHRADLLNKLNKKIQLMKERKNTKEKKFRIKKKHYYKVEKKKKDLVDKLHWDVINDLLKNNDVVYFGNIKSHNIVKDGKNTKLNTDFNDLKFYQFKQRLLYKAYINGKKVYFVNEHYTTKTCSCCGEINNKVGCKEVFNCNKCLNVTGRDFNASKNIKMKGILSAMV